MNMKHVTLSKPLQRKNYCTLRLVPPFSIQSRQKGVIVEPPPKADFYKVHSIGMTSFRKYYERGDFPISMEFDTYGYKIAWKVDVTSLDYHHYLPLFFDGLCEIKHPYKFFAQQGIHDMLYHGKNKILSVIPQLIIPIKSYIGIYVPYLSEIIYKIPSKLWVCGKRNIMNFYSYSSLELSLMDYMPQNNKYPDALNTRNSEIISCTLKVLQHLITSADMVGESLVPYYRQILPALNFYKDKNGKNFQSANFFFLYYKNTDNSRETYPCMIITAPNEILVNSGDGIDYSQQKRENIGDLVQETLEILERYGGEDAFINIKYMIPTYESCIIV